MVYSIKLQYSARKNLRGLLFYLEIVSEKARNVMNPIEKLEILKKK